MRILKQRLVFLASGMKIDDALQMFMHPMPDSALHRALEHRPELMGVIVWPFVCTNWNARMRLQRIEDHFRAVDAMGSPFDFPPDEMRQILDLGDIAPDLRVVLDQAKWFMREGLQVINLFIQDKRIYSLAFSLTFEDDEVVVCVGAIQGVDTEGIMDNYKDLTKALHGMRPRDFLMELFRTLCRCLGIRKIYAVNDARRQHRSSYFGPDKSKALFLNYNDIWEERGGEQYDDDFFVFSTETPMKNLDDVPSKKRAMYRRRYELLNSLEERLCTELHVTSSSLPT